MVVTGEPELMHPIAMKDDNKPIGWGQEILDMGPAQPPKKKWLDMDVSNVGELVDLLQNDVNSIQDPEWTDLKAVVSDIQTHYAHLKDLSKEPKYDNIAIGKQALVIHDDLPKLAKTRGKP